MAATQVTMEIVNSLTQNDIPIKLRCASCNKLVLDAYRLPCCDQNICGTCQASLPETCLVCAHSPIAATDCKPNKSLRLTIKAFLKSEEKKREKERGQNLSVPQTPITPTVPSVPDVELLSKAGTKQDIDSAVVPAAIIKQEDHVEKPGISPNEDNLSDTRSQSMLASQGKSVSESEDRIMSVDPSTTLEQQKSNNTSGAGVDQRQNQASAPTQFGYGGNQNGPQGMNWGQMNNNFNPMMQMQMQHNMVNGNWGYPNMMAMGMNPMDMSQGMFGGFGMQNMAGMNGMMGGIDFNSGYGWNNAQYAGNSYGGSTGGYNQGNQGQFGHSAQDNFQNQNGYHANAAPQRKISVAAQNQSNLDSNSVIQSVETSASNRTKETGGGAGEESLEKAETNNISKQGLPLDATPTANDEKSEDKLHNDGQGSARAESGVDVPGESMTDENIVHKETQNQSQDLDFEHGPSTEQKHQQGDFQQQDDYDMANQAYPQQNGNGSGYYHGSMQPFNAMDNDMNYYNNNYADESYQMPGPGVSFGFHGRGRGRGRGGWRGRGGFNSYQQGHPTAAIPVGQGVEGAPTGPKAMREGFPNRGNFRGRGAFHAQRDSHHEIEQSTAGATGRAPSAVSDTPLLETQDSQFKDESLDRSQSRSRSRSRSLSKTRKHKHRSRSRSRSLSSGRDSYERESKYRRHKSSRSRKYEDDQDYRSEEEPTNGKDKYSRASSIDNARSHRRQRDDKERHKSSRSHRGASRERRRHRHRSKSPVSDYDQDGHYDKEYRGSKPTSESGRRKSRSDRRRDYDEERGDDKEKSRYKDRDHNRDKHRETDREERKRSRKDRSASRDVEDEHRSSRRHRQNRDREKDREYDRRSRRSPRPGEDKVRTGLPATSSVDDTHNNNDEEQIEFKIQGRAKEGRTAHSRINVFNPPTGPASVRAPPTGPRALVAKISTMDPPSGPSGARRSQLPTPASSETTPAPSTPAADPHTLEREARNRERMLKEEQRRSQLSGGSHLDRKRSYAEQGDDDDGFAPPTGPRGDRDRKKKSRRVNYKYEDEENDEARARRVEKEREASRWH